MITISHIFLEKTKKSTEKVGSFVLYLYEILIQSFKPPFRLKLIFEQMEFIGVQSLFIIMLTSFFTGAVFALQIGGIFALFKAEALMGAATGLALATELAPLVSGFLITGRVGSAMTAEIATMRVNEQIDAMEAMAVDPIHYLVVPRVVASLLTMPFLCGIFMFVGISSAYFIGFLLFEVDGGIFFEKLTDLVEVKDVFLGLRKMTAFSIIISSVACLNGLKASGGAKGVGTATTFSVVQTLLALLITDFIISYIQIRWLS